MQKGIILCGHGTKSQQGLDSFFKVYAKLEQKLQNSYAINYAFIEYASPLLSDAILTQIKNEVKEIIIIPALLFSGVHTTHDIPYTVQIIQKEHPNVTIKLAQTIGLDDKIVSLCIELIQQQLTILEGDIYNKNLLIVGVGSSQPDANIKIASLSRIIWEQLPFNYVTYSFISKMTFPSLDDELARLEKIGSNDMVVLPIILFPGIYLNSIHKKVTEFQKTYKGTLNVCQTFNDHNLLIESIVNRLDEVILGEIDLLNQAKQLNEARK